MSSDEERVMRLLNELQYLYTTSMNALYAKRSELLSLENALNRLGYPGIAAAAYVGSYVFGPAGAQYREQIDRLLRRRKELYEEIERERAYITELAQRIHGLASALIGMRVSRVPAVKAVTSSMVAEAEESRRREEIQFLLDELKFTTDPLRRSEIIKRLRQLGYQI